MKYYFPILLLLLGMTTLKAQYDELAITGNIQSYSCLKANPSSTRMPGAVQDSLPEKYRHFLVYAETMGHNYYGFESAKETGYISLNLGFRIPLMKLSSSLMVSAGWGTFKEKHSSQVPFQPRVYFYDRINYIPCELTLQTGLKKTKHHFLEIGFAYTLGFGNQIISRESTSPGPGPAPLYADAITKGYQFVPRIGYVFIDEGITIRIAATPHFGTGQNSYGKSFWIPVGLSIGYAF